LGLLFRKLALFCIIRGTISWQIGLNRRFWGAARVLKQIPPLRHAGSVPSVGMTGCTGGCIGFGPKKIGFDWPFDFAQGRGELEFWPGIGFDWV